MITILPVNESHFWLIGYKGEQKTSKNLYRNMLTVISLFVLILPKSIKCVNQVSFLTSSKLPP